MNKSCMFMLSLSILCFLATPVASEVRIAQEYLSVHVDNQSISQVLHDLSQQGAIRVTVFEKESIAEMSVTHHFDHVTLQEGLSRLLAQWNYGLSTDRGTGSIREIFVVSKRINPNDLPALKQSASSLRYPITDHSNLQQDDSLVALLQEDKKIHGSKSEEVRESNDSAYLEDDEITAKILPPDLPSEIREEFLRDLAANQDVPLETR